MRTMQLGGAGNSFGTMFKDIYAKHGVGGFYRGWASTIMRDTPFSILYWMCFERLRLVYNPILDPSSTALSGGYGSTTSVSVHYSPVVNFLSGATSGKYNSSFPTDHHTKHQIVSNTV